MEVAVTVAICLFSGKTFGIRQRFEKMVTADTATTQRALRVFYKLHFISIF